MDLIKEVLKTITKHQLIQRGDVVVVGVSGGADSVCLLSILNQLKHNLGIQIHVAHFNHRLRVSSDQDEVFVRNLAAQFNLSITVECRKGILKSKLVSEDQARQWRFKFFSEVANKAKAEIVALAHNQNDLAETVLMRLLRGAGLSGLKGILVQNQMEQVRFIRPLLPISRSRIEQYLKKQRLQYCTDETNSQVYYLRNKIRHQLLPYLAQEYNNNISSILIDLAYTAGEDYDYLISQARQLFKKITKTSKNRVQINLVIFQKQHQSLQRMLLRLSYEHLTSNLNQLTFVHVQEVQEMLLMKHQATIVHWPKSVKVFKSEGILNLSL